MKLEVPEAVLEAPVPVVQAVQLHLTLQAHRQDTFQCNQSQLPMVKAIPLITHC